MGYEMDLEVEKRKINALLQSHSFMQKVQQLIDELKFNHEESLRDYFADCKVSERFYGENYKHY